MSQWTKQQNNAIYDRGGSLLVSAAAGSGKTAVLVQRIIEKITDEQNPVDVDKLIVVTFTKAAANEMHQRINDKLTQLLKQNPNNENLIKQKLLINQSKISTIHSLCKTLVSENFQKLNISPDFRLGDVNEIDDIKNKVLDDLLNDYYNSQNQEFLNLLDFMVISNNDDIELKKNILNLHNFICSLAFKDCWLDNVLDIYKTQNEIKNSIWGKEILNYSQNIINQSLKLIEKALILMENDNKIFEAYGEAFYSDEKILKSILNLLKNNNWDNITNYLKNISYARFKSLRKYEDEEKKDIVKHLREQVKNSIKKMSEKFFNFTEQEYGQDMEIIIPILEKLFEIVKLFDNNLWEVKQQKNIIDFNDLEQLTLKLLINKNEENFETTNLCKEISKNINEILIDEYQDTNQLQDTIFKALSTDEKNVFMVGDIKQSIYSFRQAMPDIFNNKRKLYNLYDENQQIYPATIILANNFRSRKSVTNTVNFIFSQIMSDELGDVCYNELEQLDPSGKFIDVDNCETEIDILDLDSINSELDKTVLEANYVAGKISKMLEQGYMVQDKSTGTMRQCEPKDFAILLRTINKKSEIFKKALDKFGISGFANKTKGYFNTREIVIMLSLLKIIDNPMLDVELLSVMLSPMFLFTPDEISIIKMQDRKESLYLLVEKTAGLGDEKCINFINIIKELRTLSIVLPLENLIQDIYDKTDFICVIRAISNGESQQDNLRLFLEYAKSYEQSGGKGLSGFINYIDRVISNGGDFDAANTVFENSNCVKIMSIHSSKGLEFPICFLCDCDKSFNEQDLNKDVLINYNLGYGIKINDKNKLIKYSTLQYEAIKLKIKKSLKSEELRLLYVALTRAKEKLIMTMTIENLEKRINKYSLILNESININSYVLSNVSKYSDWILISFLRHINFSKIVKKYTNLHIPTIKSNFDIKLNLIDDYQEIDFDAYKNSYFDNSGVNKELLLEIQKNINSEYLYKKLNEIPVKLSVTQATKQNKLTNKLTNKPKFMLKDGVTSAEKGTFLHNFMQFADYEKARVNVKHELDRLVSLEYLTIEQAEHIDLDKLKSFFNCDLYKRIETSSEVIRELKFMYAINSGDVIDDLDDNLKSEKILLQGIADCVFLEDDQIVIVDYKTDYVKDKDELIKKYYSQLELYKKALSKTLNKKVKQCVIYSFFLETEINL